MRAPDRPTLLDRIAALFRRPGSTPPPQQPGGVPQRPVGAGVPAPRQPYPGDFTGTFTMAYTPVPDGRPDPGEIVWTWVPFEEDHSRGKDRPVLLVGRDDAWLLALMLTSKDHDRDAAQEARFGRYWQDIGAGPWDRAGRPSEVRLDRVIRVDPAAVRREGAVLDRGRFEEVSAAVARLSRGG